MALIPTTDTPSFSLGSDNYKRKIAYALMMQGADSSPVQAWTQGAARALQGALGGYEMYQDDQKQKADEADTSKAYLNFLNPGAGASTADAATPSTMPQTAPPGSPVATALADPYKIYSNDQPSPLDPPSGQDRLNMIKTILGEENTPQGQAGVANVIRNRAVDGSYGGDTPSAVVQAPNQFEPWNTQAGRSRMVAALQDPKQVAQADAAIKGAYGEGGQAPNDPTEGKTMFFSPGAQAALGRAPPTWAQGPGQMLGKTAFYDDNSDIPANAQPTQGTSPYQVAGPPTASPAPSPVAQALAPQGAPPAAAAAPDDPAKAQIAAMLQSQNPQTRKMGQTLASSYITSKMTADNTPVAVGGKLVTKTGKVVYDGADEPKWGIVGKDKYGQPVYGYPPTREDYNAQKSAAPQTDTAEPDLTNVHGKEYLTQLQQSDPKLATQVQAIVEGRAPYPTGMLLKTPYGQDLAQHVTQADPSFEAGNATARVKVRNEFKAGGVGSPAGQISAGNTALQHAGEMSDALERMKSPDNEGVLGKVGESGVPFMSYYANKMHNAAVQGTPDGKAYNDFMTAKNHFSEEVTKFYAGSAGSEAERARALANLDAAKSLPELRSAIKTEANLMQGKVNALQERWRNGMGPLVDDFPLISKESQSAVDRIKQRDQASDTPQATATQASNTKAPTGVDPKIWAHMTPQEQALWK